MERANLAAADAAGLLDIAADVVEGALGALEKYFARGGEAHGTGCAVKERAAENLLEFADLLRKRGLGEMKALRRAAEVQFFRDGYEVP